MIRSPKMEIWRPQQASIRPETKFRYTIERRDHPSGGQLARSEKNSYEV